MCWYVRVCQLKPQDSFGRFVTIFFDLQKVGPYHQKASLKCWSHYRVTIGYGGVATSLSQVNAENSYELYFWSHL